MADTVTVLRDGHSVAEAKPLHDYTRDQIVDLMVGRAYSPAGHAARTGRSSQPAALEWREVSTRRGHRDISLSVSASEIVCLYGLVGAGRTELAHAVLGLDEITAGEVAVHGKTARIRSVGEALGTHKIGYVPENRKKKGASSG